MRPVATCCLPPRLPLRSAARTCPPRNGSRRRLGVEHRPLGPARWNSVTTRDFYRAILEEKPYPVRGLLGFGSNMVLAHADGGHGRKALAALEFYAHCRSVHDARPPSSPTSCCPSPHASNARRLKIGFEISPEAQSLIQLRQAVGAAARRGSPRHRHHFRSRRPAGPRRRLLERRHRRRLSPPARPQRRHPGAVARRSVRGARAAANAPRQARRA